MTTNIKLTQTTIDRFCQAIQLGSTITMACQYAGFSTGSYYKWMKLADSEPGSIFEDFRSQVERAKGKAAIGWLAKIESAANDGAWQAAAWKLERRYPNDFGRRVQELHHSGKVEAGLDAELVAVRVAQQILESQKDDG